MLNCTPDDVKETSTSTVPVVDKGVYPGIISLILDLGIQRNKKFESLSKPDDQCTDKDYTTAHQLWYSFTLPTERYEAELEDGTIEPRDQILGKAYKVSKDDRANLQKMYSSLVTDGRTYGAMIEMPCTVTVGHTSGGKAKVEAVSKPMKGMKAGDPLRKPMVVDSTMWDTIDETDLPDFLKEMVKNRVQ